MADLRIVDAPVLLQESITDDVKMPTGGLGNYAIRLGDLVWYVVAKENLASKSYVDLSSKGVKNKLDEHIADKANPHNVTKAQVGLGNVDNTADIDKPVSDATKSAITTATNDMATKAYVNSKDGDLSTLTTTDKTSLVKAINEVVSVKANKDDVASSISSLTNNKADKATTLTGYGITDAYTKSEIDTTYNGIKTLYNKNVEAGGGVNNWTATLVKDKSGLTQQQINDLTYAHFVEKWGAKGDGVTQDSQAIQAAIDELHTKWLSTNKEATLLFTADKTYLCHNITIKAGVHLACKNGKAKLLKTPADATDTAETLKWRRVITMDNGIGIKAPNIRHRIENLIIDGNYNNLNWAFNTYDQEQGMNIILSARNGDNADTRAKFELTNVESINSTSDGVCVNTNVDVLINNYKAINCFRGGLVAVGGNSIINGIDLVFENAVMHAEVDGPGYGNSLKADIDVTNVNINKSNPSALWGGIVCHVKNGANQTYSNVNSYTHGLNILAGDDNQDNKIIFTDCRLNWKGGSHNVPKLLQFNNCTFVSDMRGVTEVTDGFSPYWKNNYTAETNGAEVIFNGGQAYALYDDITKVGAFIKFNTGGITDDVVNKPYKMVRFLNGFKIKDFRLPYASAYGGTSVEFDNVYINTRNFLNPSSNTGIVAGGTYIELGDVKLGNENTQVYSSIGFADVTKIVIRNTIMPLSSFVKNISNGGNYPTFWDVEGQMTLTTQSLGGINLNNTLAFPGTRLVVINAKNGYPCEYIAYPKNMNGTKSSLSVKWVATKWLTGSFATADLPVLTAFDVGVTNFDTTTNTFKRWSGTAWI